VTRQSPGCARSPRRRQSIAPALEAFLAELSRTGRSLRLQRLQRRQSGLRRRVSPRRPIVQRSGRCVFPAAGIAPGVIQNVTDGRNAFLVAVAADGAVLCSEEEIVDANRQNRISDIFLIDRRCRRTTAKLLARGTAADAIRLFESRQADVGLNPQLAAAIAEADLIVYAPGTQHSSLFPSYLTPGLPAAIARNLHAIKLLITNIQADAEITGSSAVDLIERAVYYLKERGRVETPTSCLITHYVVNDPAQAETSVPYVPLGQIDLLEDPRLVRIANYEDGVTGRHDASKILGPFIQSFLERRRCRAVAVLLHDAQSLDKITQSILEMIRGGIQDLPLDVTMFYEGEPMAASFVSSLPFGVVRSRPSSRCARRSANERFDYVVLFESSGHVSGRGCRRARVAARRRPPAGCSLGKPPAVRSATSRDR
jgi:hypothetical protein